MSDVDCVKVKAQPARRVHRKESVWQIERVELELPEIWKAVKEIPWEIIMPCSNGLYMQSKLYDGVGRRGHAYVVDWLRENQVDLSPASQLILDALITFHEFTTWDRLISYLHMKGYVKMPNGKLDSYPKTPRQEEQAAREALAEEQRKAKYEKEITEEKVKLRARIDHLEKTVIPLVGRRLADPKIVDKSAFERQMQEYDLELTRSREKLNDILISQGQAPILHDRQPNSAEMREAAARARRCQDLLETMSQIRKKINKPSELFNAAAFRSALEQSFSAAMEEYTELGGDGSKIPK